MWKRLIDISLKLFDLTRTVDRHTKQIAQLEKQVFELQQSLREFALTYQKDREREETERKLLLVQLENQLLRRILDAKEHQKTLPPAAEEENGEA